MTIDRAGIVATEAVIRPWVRRTPVVGVPGASIGASAATVAFKLEFTQWGGSFKARGAFTNILTRDVPASGVVAASGGNHGAAVAYAARACQIPATIFIPTVASPAKVDRIRGDGASLVIVGDRYADALAASIQYAEASGALPIHAFDHEATILGQGTLALELEEQVPDIDTVLVPVGGGGLISGIASWFAGRARVVGVEPELAPTLTHALDAGQPVDAPAGSIAVDSLAPARIGRLVLPIAQRHVDRVVLVTDDQIADAQRRLWELFRVVTEPGGAAAAAALFSKRYVPQSEERVAVILSGGNTTAVSFPSTAPS